MTLFHFRPVCFAFLITKSWCYFTPFLISWLLPSCPFAEKEMVMLMDPRGNACQVLALRLKPRARESQARRGNLALSNALPTEGLRLGENGHPPRSGCPLIRLCTAEVSEPG